MSALTMYQGLEERLRTIPDLKNILLGEPTAVQQTPCVATVLSSFTRFLRNNPPATNKTGMDYLFVIRLYLQWQDFQQAQKQLLQWIDAIPDAIDKDPRLGGRIYSGIAYISDGVAGFITVGSTKYLTIDYTCHIEEKRTGT